MARSMTTKRKRSSADWNCSAPPTPPSRRLKRAIPGPLEDLVLECLAKDPNERPQSARDLARRLRQLMSLCDAPWDPDQAQAWWDEKRPLPGGPDLGLATTVTREMPVPAPQTAAPLLLK